MVFFIITMIKRLNAKIYTVDIMELIWVVEHRKGHQICRRRSVSQKPDILFFVKTFKGGYLCSLSIL